MKRYIEQRHGEVANVTSKNYDHPSWAFEQAHKNGQMESFEEIWKLLP